MARNQHPIPPAFEIENPIELSNIPNEMSLEDFLGRRVRDLEAELEALQSENVGMKTYFNQVYDVARRERNSYAVQNRKLEDKVELLDGLLNSVGRDQRKAFRGERKMGQEEVSLMMENKGLVAELDAKTTIPKMADEVEFLRDQYNPNKHSSNLQLTRETNEPGAHDSRPGSVAVEDWLRNIDDNPNNLVRAPLRKGKKC